jgi:hypothetical protein
MNPLETAVTRTPSMMASALSRDTQTLRAARARFFFT